MAKPAPRGNFTQTLILAAVIFLGLQLVMMSQKPASDPRPVEEFIASVRKDVEEIKAASAQRSVPIATIVREWEAQDRKLQVRIPHQGLNATQTAEMLRYQNQLGLDNTAATFLPYHNQKVEAQAKQEKWNERRKREAEIEGLLLTADAQYRQGLLRSDTHRQDLAFLTLQSTNQKYQGEPAWIETQYQIPTALTGSNRSITGKAFFDELVDKLSVRSKSDKVGGVIPGYQVIDSLVAATGRMSAFSYAAAAFLLALIVRGVVFPLAQKQYRFGRQMSQLQPLVKEIKEQFTDKKTNQITDPQQFQKRTMDLYREYGINPFAGCLPTFIQIPFFLVIYQCMVAYRFEFQNGTFLWINPGSAAATNGFIAPNLGERDYILIGIYAISMVVTTLLTPVSDPTNAKQQRLMGVGIAVFFSIMMFFWPLPSAFVLYWVFTNLFATAQMLLIYRQPAPPLVKVNAPGGGVLPLDHAPTNGSKPTSKGTPVRHRPKKK